MNSNLTLTSEVWYMENILIFFGNKKANYPKLQKCVMICFYTIMIVFLLGLIYFACNSNLGYMERLINGFLTISTSGCLIMVYGIWKYGDIYKNCMVWCSSAYKPARGYEILYREAYAKWFKFTKIFFKGLIILVVSGAVLLTFVSNVIAGKLVMPSCYWPYLKPDTTAKFWINMVYQQIAVVIYTFGCSVVLAVAVTTFIFCIATLDLMGGMVKRIDEDLETAKNRWDYFVSNMKLVIDLQCEVIEMEKTIQKLTSPGLFGYVAAVNAIFLVSCAIMFIDSSQFFLTLGGIYLVLEYYILCFVNHQLNDAHYRFYEAICDLEWYNWKVKEQKFLIPMMALSLRPKLLIAGGLVKIDNDSFVKIIKRGYSVGIFMKDCFAKLSI